MTTSPLPRAAGVDHLTDILRRAGALGSGRVAEVVVESSHATILSRITRLRLTYDGDAARAPRSLIFKTALAERGALAAEHGRQEVSFYTHVAPAVPQGLLPICFEAHQDATTPDWHLLLEDLTDSHAIATKWPLPPSNAQCEAMLTTLARVHAALWDNPRLGVSIGAWRDDAGIRDFQQRMATHYARFADLLGDRLSTERRVLYETTLAAVPRLLSRHRSHRNVTIVHGDAHTWNFFVPNHGGNDIRVFDWDGWRLGIGATDPAYMMALHWYPERRQRLEVPLLDRYHDALLSHGVTGYDRRALSDDYRLAALMQIFTPVFQAVFDIPAMIWWNHLERIMLAVDDLGCRDLLG